MTEKKKPAKKPAAKRRPGHPRIIETAAEMQKKIDAYFKQCQPKYAKSKDGKVLTDKHGKAIIIDLNAPSVTGMALFLGYADRQSIYDNQKIPEFSCILKKARAKVEEWVYQAALMGTINYVLAIFILKQFGYSDKQEIEHSGLVKIIDDIK